MINLICYYICYLHWRGSRGATLMQIVPLIFGHMGEYALCGLKNTPKSVFGLDSAPDPDGGAHDVPPNLLVG